MPGVAPALLVAPLSAINNGPVALRPHLSMSLPLSDAPDFPSEVLCAVVSQT